MRAKLTYFLVAALLVLGAIAGYGVSFDSSYW
jgi:hypothetical protein